MAEIRAVDPSIERDKITEYSERVERGDVKTSWQGWHCLRVAAGVAA